MNLTLRDRVIILNTVLPQYDTRANMMLKIAIDNKIAISDSEQKKLVVKNENNGQVTVGFKNQEDIYQELDFAITDAELEYLKARVDFIDRNGMFSDTTMPTYDKIINAEFSKEYYEKDSKTDNKP